MFTLNIECSKDFDELHLVFSDGTVSSISSEKTKNPAKMKTKDKQKETNFLDFGEDKQKSSSQKIKLPEIETKERLPMIAEELQNLDI